MIVKINFLRRLFYLLSTCFLFSCNHSPNLEDIEKENTYRIISLLVNNGAANYTTLPSFPPAPEGRVYKFTIKDSLNAYKRYHNELNRKKTFAIREVMKPLKQSQLNFNDACFDNHKINDSSNNEQKEEKLILSNIFLNSSDIVIPYSKTHEEAYHKGFNEIDILYDFSTIQFNQNMDKAIILMTISYEKLDSSSIVYLLEKENYHWKVKCSKTLSIS